MLFNKGIKPMRKQVIMVVSSFILMGNTTKMESKKVIEIPNEPEINILEEIKNSIVVEEVNQIDDFLNAIGHYESRNNYKAVNTLGYMGRYQFGRKTLKGLGYKCSKSEFLNSPTLQEKAMLDLLEHNQRILQRYIDYWDGRTIKGNTITKSGILAAAHLAGAGNVKRYFMRGEDFSDAYGTKLTKYLHTFSGYNIKIN